MHQVFGMILNAITVGVIFSRVSFPQQRGRTIAISDSAVIARRDGILKFMFRIADIRKTQVRLSKKLNCELNQILQADMSLNGVAHLGGCYVILEGSDMLPNRVNMPLKGLDMSSIGVRYVTYRTCCLWSALKSALSSCCLRACSQAAFMPDEIDST